MTSCINNICRQANIFLNDVNSSKELKIVLAAATAFQNNMDNVGRSVQGKLDVFSSTLRAQLGIQSEFAAWLNENEGESWYGQLSIYLSKLPLKAMYNTISLMRCVIESACHTAVHPVKGYKNLSKALLRLAEDLAKPKTYALFGASMIGASFAQAFVLSNPMLLSGAAVGCMFILGGLLGTGLRKDITTHEAREGKIFKLIAQLPEAFLGGFLFGALVGKVQQIGHARVRPTFHQISHRPFHHPWVHVHPSRPHIHMPHHTMHPLARPYPLRPSIILPMPRPFPAAPLGSFTSVANSAGLSALGTMEGIKKRDRAHYEKIK